MQNKKASEQKRGEPKGNESPSKPFKVVEAWLENNDKLEDEHHDIPLFGHSNLDPTQNDNISTVRRAPADNDRQENVERAAKEVGDNVEMNEMLFNIMEALKEEGLKGPKKAEKKKYEPLTRVEKKEPEIPKPAFATVNQNNSPPQIDSQADNDIKIEDFNRTHLNGGRDQTNNSPKLGNETLTSGAGDFSVFQNQGGKPFAGALFPSAKINDPSSSPDKDSLPSDIKQKGNVNGDKFDKRRFESNDSTINNLSMIEGQQGGIRANLDSQGSYVPAVNLFGRGTAGTDRVSSPGINMLDSPDGFSSSSQNNSPQLRVLEQIGEASVNTDSNLPKSTRGRRSQQNQRRGTSTGPAGQPAGLSGTGDGTSGINQAEEGVPVGSKLKKDFNWVSMSPDAKAAAEQGPQFSPRGASGSGTDGENAAAKKAKGARTRGTIGVFGRRQPIESEDDESRRKDRSKTKALEVLAGLAADTELESTDVMMNNKKASSATVRKPSSRFSRFGFGKNKKEISTISDASSPQNGTGIGSKRFTSIDIKGTNPTQENLQTHGESDPKYSNDYYAKHGRPSTKQMTESELQNAPLTAQKVNFDGKIILGGDFTESGLVYEEEKSNKNGARDLRSRQGKLVDETRDTGLDRDPNKHPSDITNGLDDKSNASGKQYVKDYKTGKLKDMKIHLENRSEDHPLNSQLTGDTDLRWEEESYTYNFVKRKCDEESMLLDHENNNADDIYDDHQASRSESTKIEWEEVDTPISNTMIHLFVGFRKKVTKMEELVQEVRKPEYTIDTFFERNFTFFKGRVKITKNFFFLFLILTAVMLFFVLDTRKANDLSRVRNDNEKLYIADLLIPLAIVFTYYGIAFLYVPIKILAFIVGAQVIPCGIILIVDLVRIFVQDAHFNYTRVYGCAYVVAVNLFWGVTRFLRGDIMKNYPWIWSIIFMISWCILLPTATVGFSIYISVVSRRFNYNWAHELILHIGIPTFLLLCLTWVYYHFKFFIPASKKKVVEKKSSSLQVQPETNSKEAEEKMREQFAEVSDAEEEKEEEEKKPLKLRIYLGVKLFMKRVSNTVIIASSLSLGASLIIIEGLLLIYLAEVTKKNNVDSMAAFYFAIVLYFAIPAAVLFGIPVVANNKNHPAKMLWVPFIAIAIPLFVTMPIACYLINDDHDTKPVGIFLALSPAIITAFWVTLSYIGLHRKKTKFSLMSYVFICFVIPLVVLQPIISNDGFQAKHVAQGFSVFLLVIGIIILVVFFAYLVSRGLLIKQISQKDRLNTDNYKLINVFRTDIEPFGYWSNSLGFILNFTISLYTFFHASSAVPEDLKGLTLGLAFCFIIFFIYNNVAIRVHTIESTEILKYGIKSLSAAIIQSARNNELYEEMEIIRDENDRLKNYTRLASIFIAIASAIVAVALSQTNHFVLDMFAAIAVGTVVIHIIFEIYCKIKTKYPEFTKAIIPLLLTYFWFVHALAFPSILQLTRVFYGDDPTKRKRVQIQLIVLVFVLTVSIIAIIANIIFKGIELEQKIKYILAYLRKQLENIAVKSDYFVLHKVFDGWMENGETKLRKMLVNRGKPAFWWPVPATNPNTKYSKVLLDFDAYKYMKLRLKKKLDNEDGEGINTQKKPRKKSWVSKCLSCFACCLPFLFKKSKEVLVDQELNEEIEELLDLQMHEVPLPPKDENEESDEESDDDDFDPNEFGDWEIETKIAENKLEISDIKFKPLDERVLRAMMYYDSGIKFAHNDKFTVDFLKFVYRLFAVGNYKYFKRRWLDYLGYKRFMILSATTLEKEFPDYMIDLVYTLYTHNVGRGQIQRRVDYSTKKNQAKRKSKKNKQEVERDQKMRVKVFPIFEEDWEGFLTHIAKRRFPNEINDKDALFRYIRWHLFPNFLHLLPSVQKQYPHEYDYLLFLIDLYMKQDKAAAEANANDPNASGTGADGQNGDKTNALGEDGLEKAKDGADANGLLNGQDGAGKDGKGGLGSGSGNDSENQGNGRKKPNCCKSVCSAIFGAIAKCGLYLGKLVGDFFMSFFFLKTNAQKKADKEFEIMQRKAEQEEKEEVKRIRDDKKAQFDLGDDPDLQEEELNKQGQFRRKRRTYPHKPSPEWPAIVEVIIKALKDAENDYEHKKSSQKQPYFIPSVRNFLTLLARIFEVYSLASFAFRVEVPWGWPMVMQEVFAFPSGSVDFYKFKIWSSLGYAIFYCYLGLISISFAKEGILGSDKATRKAGEFPSRGLAHSQILIHFSTTISVWVINTFLDLFSCDYYATPNNLYFMRQIQCGSPLHHWFIVLAAFGLLFYYPISSFLYPNLQYLNVGNDLKYDPSFVVVFNQAKLIIIAVTVFFPYSNEVVIPLLVSIALWIGLAIASKLLKPNSVLVMNIWDIGMYFIAAWMQICALIAYFSKSTPLASTLLILGIIIILLATYGIHRFRKLPDSFEKVSGSNAEKSADKDSELTSPKSGPDSKSATNPFAKQKSLSEYSVNKVVNLDD